VDKVVDNLTKKFVLREIGGFRNTGIALASFCLASGRWEINFLWD